MVIELFLAAAVLLFLFGLLWPGKAGWLKWVTRIAGILGTLFVLLVLWALTLTGHLPMLDGKPVDRWLYAFAVSMLSLLFWAPGIGLWLGRKAGRFIRTFTVNVQETNL